MADNVNPSPGGTGTARTIAQAIKNHGLASGGWVVPQGEVVAADEPTTDVDGSHIRDQGGFRTIAVNPNDIEVTIGPGEAFVGGAWLAQDSSSYVSVEDNTDNQLIYVGYNADARESVLVDTADGFADEDEKTPIWSIDVDNGTFYASDRRNLSPGEAMQTEGLELGAGTAIERLVLSAVAGDNGRSGDHINELLRAPGDESDLLVNVSEPGLNRTCITWNAYYDTDTNDWRYIVGNEPAHRLRFHRDNGIFLETASGGTADDVAEQWWGFRVDQDGDLLVGDPSAGQDTLWDQSDEEIPRGRLGGPAGEIDTYPISSPDIAEGDLDVGQVGGYTASDLRAGSWDDLGSISGDDPNTGLSFTTGTINADYDLYKIVFSYMNKNPSEHNWSAARVNGVSESVYSSTVMNADNNVRMFENNQGWHYLAPTDQTNHVGHGEITIRGAIPTGHSGGQPAWCTMSADTFGSKTRVTSTGGVLEQHIESVDDLWWYTRTDAVGSCRFLAMNIV